VFQLVCHIRVVIIIMRTPSNSHLSELLDTDSQDGMNLQPSPMMLKICFAITLTNGMKSLGNTMSKVSIEVLLW